MIIDFQVLLAVNQLNRLYRFRWSNSVKKSSLILSVRHGRLQRYNIAYRTRCSIVYVYSLIVVKQALEADYGPQTVDPPEYNVDFSERLATLIGIV
jgi:hypothetical protein